MPPPRTAFAVPEIAPPPRRIARLKMLHTGSSPPEHSFLGAGHARTSQALSSNGWHADERFWLGRMGGARLIVARTHEITCVPRVHLQIAHVSCRAPPLHVRLSPSHASHVFAIESNAVYPNAELLVPTRAPRHRASSACVVWRVVI